MPVLTETKASDLMKGGLITIPADSPLPQAISTLEENGISGAPVTDGVGKLVGVLSLADIAKTEHVDENRLAAERRTYFLANREDEGIGDELSNLDDYSPATMGQEMVRDWMNPNVISVHPDATMKEVCHLLASEQIHRVLVVKGGVALGIISTLDVVGRVAEEL